MINTTLDKLSDLFRSEKIDANDADTMAFEFIGVIEKETRCLEEEYEKAEKFQLSLIEQRIASCAFLLMLVWKYKHCRI